MSLRSRFWESLRGLVAGEPQLGVRDGRLAPCPRSPNCVSSQAEDPRNFLPAINYEGSRTAASERAVAILRAWPRTRLLHIGEDYLHAQCQTEVLGFVDDVELSFDDREKRIHFRSASRLGYRDYGANRARMERFCREFHALAERRRSDLE